MKVDAKWLVLILIVFGGLLAAQYWAGGQWRSQQGPNLLAKDHQGNLYVGVHSTILRYSPLGKFIDQRDLMQIGIQSPTGGIAFFPNGDLLMVPQNYNPSFIQRLLMNYRITAPVRKAVSVQGGRLSRCKWETMECLPLAELDRTFSDAFWADIDQDENLFIADTSQHEILWLDSTGRLIDRFSSKSDLQFPNQIKRRGDQLLIANCNDNSLSSIKLERNQFSSVITRFPLVDARLPVKHRWPIGVVEVDDDYVVLAKGSNLMYGSIVKMNDQGVIEDVFSGADLPAKKSADFIALAWLNDELLAADFASLSIKRLSKFGEYKGDFESPEFVAVVADHRKKMQFYQSLERYLSWVFWSLLILGFTLALYLEKRHKSKMEVDVAIVETDAHAVPPVTDKRIQWLVYPFYWRNLHKWLIWFWAPSILLVVPRLFSVEEESVWRSACWLLLHGVFLLELIGLRRLTNHQLGALVPWVFLKCGKRIEVAREQAIYSYRQLGAVVLMIGSEDILVAQHGSRPLFEGDLAKEYVMRLIKIAQPLSFTERMIWLLENKPGSIVWKFVIILLYGLALMVPLLPAK